jgi:hypothetical protein
MAKRIVVNYPALLFRKCRRLEITRCSPWDNTLPNLSENSGFLTIEKCSRGLVELDRASTRGEIYPINPINQS